MGRRTRVLSVVPYNKQSKDIKMINEFSRTELLLGADGMEKLKKARVAVFGIGGVGGYAVEALARSGVGALDLIDKDEISLTNINRQIYALHSTVGKPKVEVAAERIKDINPDCVVRTYQTFYVPDTAEQFDFSQYDYVIDAIDTVTGKIALVLQAKESGTPIISSMGTGNKLDPTAFVVTDLYQTSFCPLARIMRKELRKRGVDRLKVVYSQEEAMTPEGETEELSQGRRSIPGSAAYVPSVAGMILAGEVIRDIVSR